MTNQTDTTSQASANPAASQRGQGKVPNFQDQAALAEQAFADYDFGEGVTVTDTGNWEYLDPGHERSRKVYVETEREDDGQAPRWTLNFNVRFNATDGSLVEAYALDQKGQLWGRMPEQELQGNVQENQTVYAAANIYLRGEKLNKSEYHYPICVDIKQDGQVFYEGLQLKKAAEADELTVVLTQNAWAYPISVEEAQRIGVMRYADAKALLESVKSKDKCIHDDSPSLGM